MFLRIVLGKGLLSDVEGHWELVGVNFHIGHGVEDFLSNGS